MKQNIKYVILCLLLLFLYYFSDNIYLKLTNKNVIVFTNYQNYYESDILNNYHDLLSLNDIKNPYNYNFTYTKVLYHDIYNFDQKITILKEKNDDLKVGMAVINKDALIGVINKTYDNYSEVSLITNNSTSISVKINDSYGILEKKNNKLIISGLTNQDNVRVGDKVYTSGLGNIPSSIYIGEIRQIDNETVAKTCELKLGTNLNNLNFLIVIKDLK